MTAFVSGGPAPRPISISSESCWYFLRNISPRKLPMIQINAGVDDSNRDPLAGSQVSGRVPLLLRNSGIGRRRACGVQGPILSVAQSIPEAVIFLSVLKLFSQLCNRGPRW